MKKIFILAAILLTGFFHACSEDSLSKDSIFIDPVENLEGLDLWLEKNVRKDYNILIKYKFEDIEADETYNVIPADYYKSFQMSKLIKFLLIEPYDEVVGVDFTRQYMPKIFFLVGSALYKSSTRINGTAEGGMKIVITRINEFKDPYDTEALSEGYLRTMHHEFAHILHQTKEYPQDFGLLSAEKYLGSSSWSNRSEADAAKDGFISQYAGSEPNEDFVETFARYLVLTDEWFQKKVTSAGEEGGAKILEKLEYVKAYTIENWNFNLDDLKQVVHRRYTEVADLDLNNFNAH